ncbi:MAG TPA: hypothetical protein VFH27_07735 [Longimicrobiaceae bacterium]|nr:hypothetical protein [Longimicrobiaceae bacterium]
MNTAAFGVEELDERSIREISGGEEGDGGIVRWIVVQVIENWDHVKAGFSDGYSGSGYNPR